MTLEDPKSKTVNALYELRSDFLILGLTGRLGSGCSTVANLLTNKTFGDCKFPVPENETPPTNENRKYKIVYNFLKENWEQFFLIRASDIITMLVIKEGPEKLKEFLINIYPEKSSEIEAIFKLECFTNFSVLQNQINDLIDKEGKLIITEKTNDIYDLFVTNNEINPITNKLKEAFKLLNITNGDIPFQHFGNNLRKTGNPFDGSDFNTKNCYIISEHIHQIIKVIRIKNDKKARIVIDSVRNSLEARYFKERFSGFYLFAVNTEDEIRKLRLVKQYNTQQINALDQEYTKDLNTEERFYKQDIQTCIQVADIYLYNPKSNQSEGDSFNLIKRDVLRYLSLILHPGIITPTPEERCMQIAYTAKYNSGCISRQVGAVVTDNSFSLKSLGWNNTAEGQTPCLLRNVDDLASNTDASAYSEYEKSDEFKLLLETTFKIKSIGKDILKGRNVPFCFKDAKNCMDGHKNQVHTRSLHAEENAMLQIAKYGGEGLKNGFLFTTASPCELCSKKAYQIGIKNIYYIDPYPGISEKQILQTGIDKHRPKTILFRGAVGRAYHQLFEPFMAYKDELKTILNYDYKKNLNSLYPEKYKEKLEKEKARIELELKEIAKLEENKNS